MHLMDLYLLLCKHEKPLINAIGDEESVCLLTDPTMAWITRVAPGKQRHFDSPRPIHNHFTKGLVSEHTALSVTVSPGRSQLNLAEIGQLYSLPEFAVKIQEYIAWCIDGGDICSVLQTFNKGKLWYKFRIQRCSTSLPSVVLPSQAVQAQPPSVGFPLGNCDAVLLNMNSQSKHNPGCRSSVRGLLNKPILTLDILDHITQVRAVFQLTALPHSKDKLPDFLAHSLLYIQPFIIITDLDSQLHTRMWMLERAFTENPGPPELTR